MVAHIDKKQKHIPIELETAAAGLILIVIAASAILVSKSGIILLAEIYIAVLIAILIGLIIAWTIKWVEESPHS